MIYHEDWKIQTDINKRPICKKCLAQLDNGNEIVNAEILYIKKNGDIVGTITSNIITKHKQYKMGDLIYFQRKHIVDLLTFQERKDKATSLIPDIMKMCGMFRKDFISKHNREPTKEESVTYFDKHVNIL